MTQEIGYNEDKAVRFIRDYMPENIADKYSDDEILCVVDIIWDYYEKKGLLSLNDIDTEEELLNEEELTDYVKQEVKADGDLIVDMADIKYIVKGELEYEESLEDII